MNDNRSDPNESSVAQRLTTDHVRTESSAKTALDLNGIDLKDVAELGDDELRLLLSIGC